MLVIGGYMATRMWIGHGMGEDEMPRSDRTEMKMKELFMGMD
jgi:hypothetical protein